jgi:hypothetical protein
MGIVVEFDPATEIKRNARAVINEHDTFVICVIAEDGSIGMVHSDLPEGGLEEIVEALDGYAKSTD